MRVILIGVFVCIALLLGCQNKIEDSETESSTERQEQTMVEDQLEHDHNQTQNNDIEEDNPERVEMELGAQYRVSNNWLIEPINDNTKEKVVLLTIDDAPDEHALHMAKTLYKLDANAIFFVNGHLLETEDKRQVLKKIYDMGFMIGNHTYSHAKLTELSEEEQLEEIIKVNDMVEKITGERPSFFRAPFGMNTEYSQQIASNENMILMNWSYGYDWEKDYMSKEALTDIMLNTDLLRSGANLLMHDREWTSLALPEIVVGLRNKGYEIVEPKLIQTMN